VLHALAGPQRLGVPTVQAMTALGCATVLCHRPRRLRAGSRREDKQDEGGCRLVPITPAWHGWAHGGGLGWLGAAEQLLPGWQRRVLLVPSCRGWGCGGISAQREERRDVEEREGGRRARELGKTLMVEPGRREAGSRGAGRVMRG